VKDALGQGAFQRARAIQRWNCVTLKPPEGVKPAVAESWIEFGGSEAAVVAAHERPALGPGFDEGIKAF
jgi:hypothetical protein